MNLYLNVIFKVLLLNNILKQKIPLKIQEKYIHDPNPVYYDIPTYPKINFNDINVINKLNEMLETKIENTLASTGGGSIFDKNKILNDIMNDVNKLKNIKNNKTLKKKIGKVKNRHELEDKINAKIKKYIKIYLKKKEKQLENLELQIINAKKNLDVQFNKKENKNKIKSRLNSNINKKINKFNKNTVNSNGYKNKKNTSRKKYE
jgi:ATP-dependent Lon protease